MKETLFFEIDALYEKYLKIWEDVCNIESPTDYKSGVDAVGEYFANMARGRGWQVEVFEQPVSGNVVCITMNPDAKGRMICLSGHMDTVHPIGAFGTPAVRIEGDRIYGPGVVDCKGGLVVGFLAMDALDRAGFRDRPVRLLLQSDEECGSRYSKKATINYICDRAKGAEAFFNLEGHSLGKNALCLQRKGIINFEFTVHGVAGHSSQCATIGSNAILEAAHKIIELEKFKDANGLTCCCSLINGGVAPNTIPDICVFSTNVRFATQEQADWITDYVGKLAAQTTVPGCSCTVKIVSTRKAMELVDRNLDLFNRMNEIYEKNGMKPFCYVAGAGGSDAAEVTCSDIPAIDSIGAEGGKIHTTDEFGLLRSLEYMAKKIAIAIMEL